MPVTLYVIVAVPAVTPLITPVEELIVATAGVPELQVPPVTVEVKVVVPLTQIACVPLRVPAVGGAVTVTSLVAVTLAHPPVPVTLYVIVAVPAVTPLIAPVDASIVATAGVPELQVPPATVEPAVGGAVTVILTVDDTALHGLMPVVVKVKVAGPLNPATGVQVDVKELALLNVPLGAVHVPPVAEPPTLPDKADVVPP